jgi:pimeloyl-ACP methyl ester carboxylesterase
MNTFFTFAFLFVDYNMNRLKDPQKFPPVPTAHFFTQYNVEFYYAMGKFIFYPAKFVDLTVQPKDNTNLPPKYAILLVHGYGRNQTDWLWFRKQFTNLNVPVYTVNLKPALGSIQEIAYNTLTPKINTIKQQTNCDKVILIGHSMGGLVSSYYAEYLDDAGLISKVISIATPYHGTKLSLTAADENAKQMYPNSVFTQELREKIAKSKKEYYLVFSTFDNIIFPWNSPILDSVDEKHRMQMNYISHLALLHTPQVAERIDEWIAVQ